MSMTITIRSGAIAGLMLLGAAGPFASTALAQSAEQCRGFPNESANYACMCGEDPEPGSVWGSNPYTSDSDVCTAALHAGVIDARGGMVYLERQPGQSSYEGTTRNDVSTSSWGSYHTSYSFVKGPSAGLPPCEAYPREQASYSCQCDGTTDGWVWGSGPYTADSDICTAATHAGVVGPNGGEVTALGVMGLQSYTGSSQNGVTTSSWGSYGTSFVFDAN